MWEINHFAAVTARRLLDALTCSFGRNAALRAAKKHKCFLCRGTRQDASFCNDHLNGAIVALCLKYKAHCPVEDREGTFDHHKSHGTMCSTLDSLLVELNWMAQFNAYQQLRILPAAK